MTTRRTNALLAQTLFIAKDFAEEMLAEKQEQRWAQEEAKRSMRLSLESQFLLCNSNAECPT
jgi:hypothetical protein